MPIPRKPPRKLFKIGELIHYTGLSRQTLHNYTVFGLIREEDRTLSGHRLYGEEVFETLAHVEDLKKQGLTLKEIREALQAERQAKAT
ncbi:MAG: MerR family transcriptional regulator [Planctomycetes bacterium]|nr:MerR family transcriptional regulator [Planctomycetota bacterium]